MNSENGWLGSRFFLFVCFVGRVVVNVVARPSYACPFGQRMIPFLHPFFGVNSSVFIVALRKAHKNPGKIILRSPFFHRPAIGEREARLASQPASKSSRSAHTGRNKPIYTPGLKKQKAAVAAIATTTTLWQSHSVNNPFILCGLTLSVTFIDFIISIFSSFK